MKVIITGVTGQDGSLMADYLLKNTDYEIIGGVRRISVKNHSNIKHLLDNPRFTLVDLDVTDAQNIDKVIRDHEPDCLLIIYKLTLHQFCINWNLYVEIVQIAVITTQEVLRSLEMLFLNPKQRNTL